MHISDHHNGLKQSKMSTKKPSRLSEQVTGAVHKYISRRKLDTKRSRCVSLEEMTSRSVMSSAASTSNIILFSYTSIDHSMAESQYTAFKFWISESEDLYKPELAQLLYPLFTHLYIALLTNCPTTPSPATKFHKRHLATFLGNPEFKQFIHQLGELSCKEDLDQNPSVASFMSSKYSVTLTEKTYNYLLSYLETTDCPLLLQILNQEVEINIGDPLGAGSRQESRAGLVDTTPPLESSSADMSRLREILADVRSGPGSVPSIALYRLQCEEGAVSCAAPDERGALLCLGGADSQLRLVSTQPGPGWTEEQELGAGLLTLNCPGPQLSSLQVLPGDSRVLRGHHGPVYGVDWVAGGGLLSAGEDCSVRYWDRDSGAGLAVYRGHQYPVWRVVSNILGSNFVTCSLDRTVRLWSTEYSHPLRIYSGHDDSVNCVAWHPNCNYIFSGSSDNTVRMWSFTDAKCVRLFPAGKAGITSVAASPDGKLAACAGDDRLIRVWDLAQGGLIKELRGHQQSSVTDLVWCQDSRLLVSGAEDGSLKVWDTVPGVEAGQEGVAQLSCGPNTSVLSSQFTDTNTLIVSAIEYCQ